MVSEGRLSRDSTDGPLGWAGEQHTQTQLGIRQTAREHETPLRRKKSKMVCSPKLQIVRSSRVLTWLFVWMFILTGNKWRSGHCPCPGLTPPVASAEAKPYTCPWSILTTGMCWLSAGWQQEFPRSLGHSLSVLGEPPSSAWGKTQMVKSAFGPPDKPHPSRIFLALDPGFFPPCLPSWIRWR